MDYAAATVLACPVAAALLQLVAELASFPAPVAVTAITVMAAVLLNLATIADVANTARWLASPAASYITGKVIEIDGGAEAPVFPSTTPDLRPPSNYQE